MIAIVFTDPVPYAHLIWDWQLYFLIFGIVMIFGGLMGFVKARSVPSLIAGGVSGLLFIVSALAPVRGYYTWAVIDLIVCVLLAGRFVPALLKRKYNPAAYVVPLAIIGAIICVVILVSPINP